MNLVFAQHPSADVKKAKKRKRKENERKEEVTNWCPFLQNN